MIADVMQARRSPCLLINGIEHTLCITHDGLSLSLAARLGPATALVLTPRVAAAVYMQQCTGLLAAGSRWP
jgi:hypothetical protein